MLNAAAQATHRSVSDIVLESALARAEETLPDRQRFGLDAEAWEAFVTVLEMPPRSMLRLQWLLTEPSLFERDPV